MNLEGCESLSGAIIGHDMAAAGRGCWGSPSSFVRVRGDVCPTLGELSTTQSYLHTTIKRRRLLDSIFRSLTHSECLFLGEFNGVHLMGGEARSILHKSQTEPRAWNLFSEQCKVVLLHTLLCRHLTNFAPKPE